MATVGSAIATEFSSFSLFAWLATTYLIATSATQPISGKLTDIFTRRDGLLLSNLLFATGNLTCGLAQDRNTIIVGRALAGLGGGGLNTISTIIASDLIPLRRRGLWQGIGNVMWGLGNGLGGVFGGYANDVWNWRVAFLVQVPLTVVSTTMVYINVEKPEVREKSKPSIGRVDFLGIFLIVTTLCTFMLSLNAGGNLVPWDHPMVLVSLPLAAVFFCAFVFVEVKVAQEPVIPVRLILNRTVASACLVNWFFIMIAYALDFYIVIFFRVRGFSSTNAGASLIPFSVMTALGSFLAGLVTNATGRYKALNVAILLLMLVATSLIVVSTILPAWTTIVALGLVGISLGGMLTVTIQALIAAVSQENQAVVTSLSYAFRSTGSVIGVALSSAIFQNVLRVQLWENLGREEHPGKMIDGIRDSLDYIRKLPAQYRLLAEQSYLRALQAVFLALFGLAILGLFSGLFIQELKLHDKLSREDVDEGGEDDEGDEHFEGVTR